MDNKDKLSGAIMNIPCARADDTFQNTASRLLYKEGHRDARHAAAELVSEAEAAREVTQQAAKAETAEQAEGDQANVLPPFAAPAILLNADELAALRRFNECALDGEGYDVPKEMMQRLAEIGVVRRKSGAYYEHTEFGLAVLAPTTSTVSAPDEIRDAIRDEALEVAALLCETVASDKYDQYKGRGKYAPNNPHRADTYTSGESDGADLCADKIRALKRTTSGKGEAA